MPITAQTALQWSEQGYLPDRVIRLGIQRMLAERLIEIQHNDCESMADTQSSFIHEAMDALTRALQSQPVRAALSREACAAPADAALDVRNEHAFSMVLADEAGEEQLWSGSIDRLVLGRRGDDVVWAEVWDYKTDIMTPDQLPARVEHYRPQLTSYGRVVA